MTLQVGIYVFDEVEVLDFAGPFEVFTTAARMHGRVNPGAEPLFKVTTIGRTGAPVRARAGLKIEPDATIADHPLLDCLVVPGGVVTAELARAEVINWIDRQAEQVTLVASVCTGSFLLAATGRLDGRRATTHWEDMDDLRTIFPEVEVVSGVRWVDEGPLLTSAGISAGIDLSLHLVERMHNRELALRTARQMDFDWTENR